MQICPLYDLKSISMYEDINKLRNALLDFFILLYFLQEPRNEKSRAQSAEATTPVS